MPLPERVAGITAAVVMVAVAMVEVNVVAAGVMVDQSAGVATVVATVAVEREEVMGVEPKAAAEVLVASRVEESHLGRPHSPMEAAVVGGSWAAMIAAVRTGLHYQNRHRHLHHRPRYPPHRCPRSPPGRHRVAGGAANSSRRIHHPDRQAPRSYQHSSRCSRESRPHSCHHCTSPEGYSWDCPRAYTPGERMSRSPHLHLGRSCSPSSRCTQAPGRCTSRRRR